MSSDFDLDALAETLEESSGDQGIEIDSAGDDIVVNIESDAKKGKKKKQLIISPDKIAEITARRTAERLSPALNNIEDYLDDIDSKIGEIPDEVYGIIDNYVENEVIPHIDNRFDDLTNAIDDVSTEQLESLTEEYRGLLEEYRDVLDEMEGVVDLPGTGPETEAPGREYLTNLILEVSEEYERSLNEIREMREEHQRNMSDQDVSDILYD